MQYIHLICRLTCFEVFSDQSLAISTSVPTEIFYLLKEWAFLSQNPAILFILFHSFYSTFCLPV